jgi:uncharacterized membrane protein
MRLRRIVPLLVIAMLGSIWPNWAGAGSFSFTTIDDPNGTNGTLPVGINDKGQVAGAYFDALGLHGFLLSGGTYTTLDDPNAGTGPGQGTQANGINDKGQVVGAYYNGGHGFLATPQAVPEPTTLALGIIGAMVLLGNAWHRRRSPTI